MDLSAERSLLCRVEGQLCALPLGSVVETTRPLPVQPVAGVPDFVLGVTVIRGAAVPVVDAGRLFAASASTPTRFVVLRVGERRVALAVEAVLGIRFLPPDIIGDLPPLLRSADSQAVASIGALDATLLVVLEALRMVPGELLARLETEALAS